jgi:hypothetical protein
VVQVRSRDATVAVEAVGTWWNLAAWVNELVPEKMPDAWLDSEASIIWIVADAVSLGC